MLILINLLIQDKEFFQYWYWNWKYWNWDIEIEKNKFYLHKAPIFLKDVYIEKVLVPKKISFGEKNYKYFIGYLCDNHEVKPLHTMLPKTRTYVNSFDEQTKWMYFLIEDEEYLR